MKRFWPWNTLSRVFCDAVPPFCKLSIVSLVIASTAAQAQDKLAPGVDMKAPEYAVIISTGEEIPYEVIDGMAIHQGDIVLGTHAEVQAYGIESLSVATPLSFNSQCTGQLQCASIEGDTDRFWPGGIVPYTLSEGTSESAQQGVAEAIAEWESRTDNIRFVERTNQAAYVRFRNATGSVCSSNIGRTGRMQDIIYTGTGSQCLVHEIGHALGLNHEQNRSDRDEFITIDFTNLPLYAVSQFAMFSRFKDVGPYDFDSVMHYPIYAFAIDSSRPVIVPIDPDVSPRFGLSRVPSLGDVAAIDLVYADSLPPPPEPPIIEPPTIDPPTIPPPPPPPVLACSATVRSRQTSNWAGMDIAFDTGYATLDFSGTGLDLASVKIDSPVFKVSVADQLVTLTKPEWVSSTSPGYFGLKANNVAALRSVSAPVCEALRFATAG